VTLVDAAVKVPLPLIEKEELSHDTRRFRFQLPSKEHCLGKIYSAFFAVDVMLDIKLQLPVLELCFISNSCFSFSV